MLIRNLLNACVLTFYRLLNKCMELKFTFFVVQLKSCQVIRSDVIKGAPGPGVES